MTEATTHENLDQACMLECFDRIATDLEMIADRSISVECDTTERLDHRPAGSETVHISFKLGFCNRNRQGALLVPLADAIAIGYYLLMAPDHLIAERRTDTDIDSTLKDALLEVGRFASNAVASAFATLDMLEVDVTFEGCQGVREDVRPALLYEEGDEMVVARAQAGVHDFPRSEWILMIPDEAVKPA